MKCPKCNSSCRLKMTGAVCTKCNWYTHDRLPFTNSLEFISQTSADAKGEYTMIWKDKDNNMVITNHNLYE